MESPRLGCAGLTTSWLKTCTVPHLGLHMVDGNVGVSLEFRCSPSPSRGMSGNKCPPLGETHQTTKHRVLGRQVNSADAIHRHDGASWTGLRECLQGVRNTRALERCCCLLDLLSLTAVLRTPPSGFCNVVILPNRNSIFDAIWHLPTSPNAGEIAQFRDVAIVLQQRPQMFSSHPTRLPGHTSSLHCGCSVRTCQNQVRRGSNPQAMVRVG